MEGLEATSLLFGSFVAILTLLSSVWYTAIAVSNRNRDILFMKEELISIKESIEDINVAIAEKNERLEEVERSLDQVIHEMVRLVYINSDHVIIEAYDGRTVKIPMIV